MKTSNKKIPRTFLGLICLGPGGLFMFYYFFMFFVLHMSFQEFSGLEESASIAKLFYFYFNDVIYSAGLLPMVLAIYFLIICRAPKSNLWGLLIVCLSIFPVHYISFVLILSGTPEGQFFLVTFVQFIQLFLTFAIIFFWNKKGIEDQFQKEWELKNRGEEE